MQWNTRRTKRWKTKQKHSLNETYMHTIERTYICVMDAQKQMFNFWGVLIWVDVMIQSNAYVIANRFEWLAYSFFSLIELYAMLFIVHFVHWRNFIHLRAHWMHKCNRMALYSHLNNYFCIINRFDSLVFVCYS